MRLLRNGSQTSANLASARPTERSARWRRCGHFNVDVLDTTDARRQRFVVVFYPADHHEQTLAVVAAERVGGPPLPASAFGAGGAWIDFRGPPGTIDAVSFSSLVDGKVDPALLRDRIVVVGASAPSLGDVHVTPTADGPMAGAEIQANAIWTALHGVPLRDASPAVDLALLLAMALVVPLARLRLRVLRAALTGPMLAAAFVVVAQVTFNDGTPFDATAVKTSLDRHLACVPGR